jgi:hypothetical protein
MSPGTCALCGGPLPPPARTGRPRRYCTSAHRSLAWYRRHLEQVSGPWTPEDGERDAAALAEWLASLAGPAR